MRGVSNLLSQRIAVSVAVACLFLSGLAAPAIGTGPSLPNVSLDIVAPVETPGVPAAPTVTGPHDVNGASTGFGLPGTADWDTYVVDDDRIQSPTLPQVGSGEPSGGLCWAKNLGGSDNEANPGDKDIFYFKTVSGVGRAIWDDSAARPTVAWEDVSRFGEVHWVYLDPILHTDEQTCRTWAGQMEYPNPCTTDMAFRDDDPSALPGANPLDGWTTIPAICQLSGQDHETVGSGPYSKDVPVPVDAVYPHIVYYCTQYPAIDSCAESYDGGLTWPTMQATMVDTEQILGCLSIFGHVKVSSEGYAAIPFRACINNAGLELSKNNGLTWTGIDIPGIPATGYFDPSLEWSRNLQPASQGAAAGNSMLYFGSALENGLYAGASKDFGTTWQNVRKITGPGSGSGTAGEAILHTEFANLVAGDWDRAAISFLGATEIATNDHGSNCDFAGIWNMYVARTFDAGATWAIEKVSTDPVQIGGIWNSGGTNDCRNILDFNDLDIGSDGRVVVSFADGCTGTCAALTAPTTSHTRDAKGTVIRQSSGLGLFAAYDEEVVEDPGSPEITITSPANDATGVAANPTVSGNVDRAGSGSGSSLSADAGGPYSGAAGTAIPIAATVTGGAGGHACAWSGTGASFGNTNACSTTAAFASATGSPFTISVTATESGFTSGTDTATVTVTGAADAGTRIGTDISGDKQANCGGTGAPAGCDLSKAAASEAGLDLAAAYVKDLGDSIRFTVQVQDGSKFFVDPVGDPAAGSTGHMNTYVLSIPFEVVSPTFGLVSGTANIERDTGSPELTGSLSQVTGVLSSTTPNAGPATYDAATNQFSVDIQAFEQVKSLSALDATSTITVENGNVDSIIQYDAGLSQVESATWAPSAAGPVQVPGAVLGQFGPGSTSAAIGQDGTQSLYFHSGTVPVGNAATTAGGNTMDATPSTAGTPAVWVGQNQFIGTSSRSLYQASWLYTGAVALDDATIDVTWHSPSVAAGTGAGAELWTANLYVYSGATAPDTDPPQFTKSQTFPLSAAPVANTISLTGITAAGDHMIVMVSPDFALPDSLVSATPIFFDSADYPGGIVVHGGSEVDALEVDANGPYAGTIGTPIAVAATVVGGVSPRTCAWSGTGAAFASPDLCATTVAFDTVGSKTITVTASDAASGSATDDATVDVTDGSTPVERVEIYEGTNLLQTANVATSAGSPTASWSTSVNGLPSGSHTLAAKWFDANVPSTGSPLATDTVSFTVGGSDPCADVTAGPVLSDIAWSAGQDSATITWSTDVASSSVVNFGTTSSYGQYASTPGATTAHSVTLTGLDAATTYHYQVVSASCGYASESVDNTFTTTGRAASVTVTSPTASSIVQAPVSFAGAFDAGDQGQTRTGTGLVVAEAGSAQWAYTVQGILASPEWQALVERLEGVKGFTGAVPELEGGATVYLSGKLPKSLPATVAGFDVTYLKAKPHTLAAPVTSTDLVGAQRNSIEQALADWEARQSEPSGPAAPGLPEGIGPGTAMLQGVNGVQFLCSVSYLFQDPTDPDQYYLSTAGHCLLATGQGVDRTGEANPSQVNNHFELCYSGCIDNALNLGSYVVLERTATYEPVAYASAAPVGAADAEGIGRDFGLLRLPKELNGLLRPWLAQWGGPDGLDSAGLGDLVVHYGHGTYCCPVVGGVASRTPADQGRVGVASGSFADGSFETVGWITGGDSGSASGIGAIDADKGVRGASALGVNTHGLATGVGVFEGTLLSKGQAMVNGKLGFTPRLVLAADEIGTGGGGGDEPAVAFTSPAEGATLDGGLGAATLTGTATFPDGAGTGTQAPVTYYLHRPGCGDAADVLAMDLVPAAAEEAGNGCGNLGATRMSQAWPATQDPGTAVPTGSTVVAHVRAFGLRPHPGVVMTGALTANGANVGSGDSVPTDVIAVGAVFTPCTEFTVAFTTTAAFAADAQLVFAASTPQGTQDLPMCYEGGTEASRVAITPLAPAENAVQVSVDDAGFGAASLLAVTGTTSWSAQWDLAGVPAGEHTLRARLVQNGVPVGPVATRHVTVEAGGESGLRTQVRLVGPGGEAFGWTTVQGHDGERAGTWSHAWSPASAASGHYTLEARLVEGQDILATSQTSFVIDAAPELAMPESFSLSEGEAFEFVLAGSDPDGDALAYTTLGLPEGASLSGDQVTWRPGFEQAGTYDVVFTASDGYLEDSANVRFTVANVNRAPVLGDVPDQSVKAGDTLAFTVAASDPDGDAVELAAHGLPDGASFDAASGAFTWAPSHRDAAGKGDAAYQVAFTASDGSLDDAISVNITVTKK